jgi:oligopeptidase B
VLACVAKRDATAFRTILAYSPYENVRAQSYPAILALAGLTDPRVFYWEPAKWIARRRRMRTNGNLIAFRTNLDAGHAGGRGSFRLSQGSSAQLCIRNEGCKDVRSNVC